MGVREDIFWAGAVDTRAHKSDACGGSGRTAYRSSIRFLWPPLHASPAQRTRLSVWDTYGRGGGRRHVKGPIQRVHSAVR